MIKNTVFALFTAVCFSLPSFAQSFDLDSLRRVNLPAAEVPASGEAAAVLTPAEPKEWTIMVYASVKDELGAEQIKNLMALKRTGTTDRMNIVAESGFTFNAPTPQEISTPTLRMLLTKSTSYASLDTDVLSTEQNVDQGDWRRVAAFIAWAKTNYPAKRYVFVPFGHGNGFLDVMKKPKDEKSTLLDKQTHNYVTVPEFGRVLRETGKVDVLLYLSCLMQTAEAAYEVKDYADVIVGSEELMSSIGYDLALLAETLDANPGISSSGLGNLMAKSYVDRVKAHPEAISGGHASVILAPRLSELSARLDGWVKAVMEVKDAPAALKARNEVARFDIFAQTTLIPNDPAQISGESLSGDLYDFVRIYTQNVPRDTPAQLLAAQRGQELMDFISNGLFSGFYYTGTTSLGYDFARTRGIAIHLAPARVSFSYQVYQNNVATPDADLAFARDGNWKTFLEWLYSVK